MCLHLRKNPQSAFSATNYNWIQHKLQSPKSHLIQRQELSIWYLDCHPRDVFQLSCFISFPTLHQKDRLCCCTQSYFFFFFFSLLRSLCKHRTCTLRASTCHHLARLFATRAQTCKFSVSHPQRVVARRRKWVGCSWWKGVVLAAKEAQLCCCQTWLGPPVAASFAHWSLQLCLPRGALTGGDSAAWFPSPVLPSAPLLKAYRVW